MVTVKQYVSLDGTSPFGEWLDGLDDPAAARVLTTMTRTDKKRQARDIADALRCWQDYKRRK